MEGERETEQKKSLEKKNREMMLQLLPGTWKCLGVRERVGVAGREERGELRPLDGSVPPNKKSRISGRKKRT